MSTTGFDLKHKSRAADRRARSAPAARAYLKGIGYDDEALAKPIIGVASTWIETMPCNFHLRALAAKVKEGIRAAGGTPMELNTIAITDGITMGTSGMKTSLVSREVIADSIELVSRGHLFDAVIALSGCDKTIPGTVMALARLDVPAVMLYGGSIPPGRFRGHDVTIQHVFEAVGAHAAGKMSDEELHELEGVASPGAGACGGQFTANTMAMAFEILGISPMAADMVPAQDATKAEVAYEAGELVMDVLRRGLRPSDIITRDALERSPSPPEQATPATRSRGRPGDDLARAQAAPEDVDHQLAGFVGDLGLRRVLGRDHVRGHRRDAEDLEGHRHRVGGELPAAGPGARARDRLELGELLVGHLARRRVRRPPRRRPGS